MPFRRKMPSEVGAAMLVHLERCCLDVGRSRDAERCQSLDHLCICTRLFERLAGEESRSRLLCARPVQEESSELELRLRCWT